MKIMSFDFRLALLLALVFLSCRSEFEKVRISGDAGLIYGKALEYYEKEQYQRAQILLEMIINAYRGKPEFEDINFKFSYTHYFLRQYITAAFYFKSFSTSFPNSPHREEASFMAAYSNYQLSPSPRLDQEYTIKAMEGFQTFINTFPNSDRIDICNQYMDELRQKLEEKAYLEAHLYYDMQNYQAAIHAFENLLKDFPDTDNSEYIRYMIIKSYFDLAENSVFTRQKDRYEQASALAAEFLTRYGGSQFHKEIDNILSTSRNKLKEFSNE